MIDIRIFGDKANKNPPQTPLSELVIDLKKGFILLICQV